MEEVSPPEKKEGQTPDQAIVAFIDILGYESLVNRLSTDLEMIKNLDNLLQGVSTDLLHAMRTKVSLEARLPGPYDEYSKRLFHPINAKFISDTIFITLNLSKVETSFPHFTEKENLSHSVFSYLYFIASACTQFIGITGLLLRGGISMGLHYENLHDGSLFIFSQAYVNAYKLEKEAYTSRILIDGPVHEFVKGLPLEQLRKFIFMDSFGKSCLDIYAIFENEPRSPAVLSGIKEAVSRNMFENRQDKRALRKLIDFAEYHNQRVAQLGFADLTLDLAGPKRYLQALKDSPKD